MTNFEFYVKQRKRLREKLQARSAWGYRQVLKEFEDVTLDLLTEIERADEKVKGGE